MKKMVKKFISLVLAVITFTSVIAPLSVSAAGYFLPEEGTYVIYCNILQHHLFLNDQFAARNNANIVLDTLDFENNELWIIRRVSGGYITLSPRHASGYYLSGKRGHDQVLTLDSSSSNTYSHWRVYQNSDGTVTFVNRRSGYAMDLRWGSDYVGNYVLSYTRNGYANAQNWHLSRISESTSSVTPTYRCSVLNGDYSITFGYTNQGLNVQFKNTRIDGSARIVLDPYNGETNEIFRIVNRGNNLYSIHPLHATNLCLNAFGGDPRPGQQLSLYKYVEGDKASLWEIYKDGEFVRFRNAYTGLFIDDECCRTQTGNPILTYSYNFCTAQKFKLKEVKSSGNTLLSPLKNRLTVTGSSARTNGIKCDYSATSGTPVYSPYDGTVTFYQTYRRSNGKLISYGNWCEIRSNDGVYKIKLCHFSSFALISTPKRGSERVSSNSLAQGTYTTVSLGSYRVSRGQLVAYSGSTGNATGPHLHIELYKNGVAVDPLKILSNWS